MTDGQLYLLETLKSFKGLKSNAEKAIEQISEDELHYTPDPEANPVSVIMHHMAGNMLSRFTDLLSTDGEKPWRKRENEFLDTIKSKKELFELWENGWKRMLDALQSLNETDLSKTIYIRNEAHSVLRALQRQLAHYAYHTGQIVYICKLIRSREFTSLSIPRGQSDTFVPKENKIEK
jgi:hypothetical protein